MCAVAKQANMEEALGELELALAFISSLEESWAKYRPELSYSHTNHVSIWLEYIHNITKHEPEGTLNRNFAIKNLINIDEWESFQRGLTLLLPMLRTTSGWWGLKERFIINKIDSFTDSFSPGRDNSIFQTNISKLFAKINRKFMNQEQKQVLQTELDDLNAQLTGIHERYLARKRSLLSVEQNKAIEFLLSEDNQSQRNIQAAFDLLNFKLPYYDMNNPEYIWALRDYLNKSSTNNIFSRIFTFGRDVPESLKYNIRGLYEITSWERNTNSSTNFDPEESDALFQTTQGIPSTISNDELNGIIRNELRNKLIEVRHSGKEFKDEWYKTYILEDVIDVNLKDNLMRLHEEMISAKTPVEEQISRLQAEIALYTANP